MQLKTAWLDLLLPAAIPVFKLPHQGDCAEGGAYGDEGGALRCLMEGNGDVAFVRDTTPIDYAANGPKAQAWSSKAPADLRLLCPAGGCAAVDSYESCSLARAPAYALVGTPAFRASQVGSGAGEHGENACVRAEPRHALRRRVRQMLPLHLTSYV